MVRILKIKELEEQRRRLLAQSEMYRQTLTLEVANIRFSAALFQRKFNRLRTISRLAGLTAPLAGLFFFRRQFKLGKTGNSFLARMLSGLRLFSQLRPLFRSVQPTGRREPKRDNFM